MHHSVKMLTPDAYEVLKSIGADFERKTGNNNDYFIVTSLTRTIEKQKKLTKTNRNATRSISSHSYGYSFDISYSQFNWLLYNDLELQNALKEILLVYQQSKIILVIKEKNTQCFHITVPKSKLL